MIKSTLDTYYQKDSAKLHAMLMMILTKIKADFGKDRANSLIIYHDLTLPTKGGIDYFE
jgi:hypothetical protein